MMAIDERGKFISGDVMLALFARALGVDEVVTTLDASMAIEEMGFRVRRTRIGDTWVSEELKRVGLSAGRLLEHGFFRLSRSARTAFTPRRR